MKRLLVIVLLFYYVGLSALNIINIHYCNNILQSVEFLKKADNCCGENESCCKNVQIKVDFKVDQLYSQILQLKYFDLEPLESIEIPKIIEPSLVDLNLKVTESPPGFIQEKLYKSYHSFLFYA